MSREETALLSTCAPHPRPLIALSQRFRSCTGTSVLLKTRAPAAYQPYTRVACGFAVRIRTRPRGWLCRKQAYRGLVCASGLYMKHARGVMPRISIGMIAVVFIESPVSRVWVFHAHAWGAGRGRGLLSQVFCACDVGVEPEVSAGLLGRWHLPLWVRSRRPEPPGHLRADWAGACHFWKRELMRI